MTLVDKLQERTFELKLVAGGYYHPVKVTVEGQKLSLAFRYNKDLLEEVKNNFEGRKWNPDKKIWTVPITPRNIFRFEVLQGKYSDAQPYEQFDNVAKYDLGQAIKDYWEKIKKDRKLDEHLKIMSHQVEMIHMPLIGRWFVWGADMGTGKTLANIIAAEMLINKFKWDGEYFWVAPRSALIAAKLDFEKWKTFLRPRFLTYEGFRDLVENWLSGRSAPQLITFDEASKLKNPVAKRTQAAQHMADSIREEYSQDSLIGQLSGTPAPKSPSDWWSLCEIACPGFIKEGHILSFRQRLAVIEKRETITGAGGYDHIVTWRDDEKKCNICGQLAEHKNHDSSFESSLGPQDGMIKHKFVPGKNEVVNLVKKRMKGLVGTWLKEDCLDLPAKRYELIRVKPDRATLNAAKLITQTSSRAIEALTRLRELSDGFQYQMVPTGEFVTCPNCKGKKVEIKYVNPSNPGETFSDEEIAEGVRYLWSQPSPEDDPDTYVPELVGKEAISLTEERQVCNKCQGKGTVEQMRRDVIEVACPKDQVLIDLLERHEECGRLNVYGGFSGTIDRITRISLEQKWAVIRADGRGWKGYNHDGGSIEGTGEMLMKLYQNKDNEDYPYIEFLGQPGAAGMGLTLTASPTTFFYSNDFNGENRMQTEDRGHRIGMDIVRGGLIVDVIHLPTDEQVLINLQKKKDLQYMAMKGIIKVLSD